MNSFIMYLKRNGYTYAITLAILYSLPLIIGNVFYIDDISRNIAGYARWADNGRPLAEWIIKGMSFGGKVINISPMPLLLSMLTMITSCYYYCFITKLEGKFRVVLISLSLIVSPFYLQNLSYKFDVFTMSLSVSLSVVSAALLLKNKSFINFATSILLLVFTLSLYQSSVNIFIALTCLNCIILKSTDNITTLLKNISVYILALTAALIIYKLLIASIYVSGAYSTNHAQLALNIKGLAFNVSENYKIDTSMILKALSGFLGGIFAITLSIAIAMSFTNAFQRKTINTTIATLICIFGVLLSVIGVLFILDEPVVYPRVLVGFSGLMFFSVYIISSSANRWTFFTPIPLIFSCFIVSYMYGNSLQAQKSKEEFLFYSMAKDITSSQNITKIRFNGLTSFPQPVQNANEKIGIIGMITPSYIRSDWMFGAFIFNSMGIKVDYDSKINLPSALASSCKKPYRSNSIYTTLIHNDTMIFDFNKCR